MKYAKRNSYSTLLQANCNKWHWTCSGVKVCKFLHPAIRSMEHTITSEAFWKQLQNTSEAVRKSWPSPTIINAYGYRSL